MTANYELYGAQRSSASYRVRIALRLKQLAFHETFVDLQAGAHQTEQYRSLNPQGLVPTLICPDGTRIGQSLAIVEFLEEAHPAPALLPADSTSRARVRALAQIIACDMHPVNNMRVRNHIRDLLPMDADAVSNWTGKWSAAGFAALEARLSGEPQTGRFCHGNNPGLADLCLVPQVYNAEVMKFDLAPYPCIRAIAAACNALPAFQAAHPDNLRVLL